MGYPANINKIVGNVPIFLLGSVINQECSYFLQYNLNNKVLRLQVKLLLHKFGKKDLVGAQSGWVAIDVD